MKTASKKVTKKVSKKTAKPKVSIATADSTATVNEILDRLRVLEKKASVLEKGLRWIGEQIAPIYGIGGIAAYFKEVADKLSKAA